MSCRVSAGEIYECTQVCLCFDFTLKSTKIGLRIIGQRNKASCK